VRDKNSRVLRRDSKHVRVRYADNTAFMSAPKIYGRFSATKSRDDLVIQIGIRLKSWPHELGV
jgi:hypothetical protein